MLQIDKHKKVKLDDKYDDSFNCGSKLVIDTNKYNLNIDDKIYFYHNGTRYYGIIIDTDNKYICKITNYEVINIRKLINLLKFSN